MSMPNIWCVRAEFGSYAKYFVQGGYIAIGWLNDTDLSTIQTREEIYPLYRAAYPEDTSNIVVGQQVGQIARFLLEIQLNDYVITPDLNTEVLNYGVMTDGPSYFYSPGDDGCPYRHRRRVDWKGTIKRSLFSVPLQNSIRSSLTVFSVSHQVNFFETIGKRELVEHAVKEEIDYYHSVLSRVLELDDREFEILITHLLTALGFEGSERIGGVGDKGVDAVGELNVANMAKIKLYVQAKRYKLDTRIAASTVKGLRTAIPFGGQGAFIATCGFQSAANDVAVETGFPRIGLINGHQLVDLLVDHWENIPQEFKDKLALKIGLVRA